MAGPGRCVLAAGACVAHVRILGYGHPFVYRCVLCPEMSPLFEMDFFAMCKFSERPILKLASKRGGFFWNIS